MCTHKDGFFVIEFVSFTVTAGGLLKGGLTDGDGECVFRRRNLRPQGQLPVSSDSASTFGCARLENCFLRESFEARRV